jgi:hypothetical protein
MIKRTLIILLIFQISFLSAQDIAIGTWRDHLPYTDALSVTEGNNIIYCSTTSAVFSYDKSDLTLNRLTLVNGLSDIGLSKIKFNNYNNKIIITYLNGNIDIVDEDKNITNLSFIKNSSVTGDKSINHIFINGNLVYLSTGFGIVVLDTDKLEIVDTYFFGPLGISIYTNAITFDDINIYAATDQGVFYADKNSTNLADYNVWTLLPELGGHNYSDIVYFSDKLFVSLDSPLWNSDSLLYNNAGNWENFLGSGANINSINISQSQLLINLDDASKIYDTDLTNIQNLTNHKSLFNLNPKEVIKSDDDHYYMAESTHGLLRVKDNWNGDIITPNGPSSTNVFSMAFDQDELWVTSGGYSQGTRKNTFNHRKNDNTWVKFDEKLYFNGSKVVQDIVSVAIDPSNSSHVFLCSFNDGLFELKNEQIINSFNAQNSVLDSSFFGSTASSDLAFDSDNNLWVLNSFTTNVLTVKTPSNDWYSFSFPEKTDNLDPLTKLLIDDNGYKWILARDKNQLIIFDDNKTLDDKSDDVSTINNNLPGANIYSFCKDLDGEIWVGTDLGIAVFYNPANVFNEDIQAERIYIQQDGQTQILLGTEIITTIKVDGANRKWIGTQSSGVYLMSEDGTEEIEHFTTENSPLFSNTIFDIVIDPKTGEVYFGTEKGLLSYKGTATDADTDFNNVFVYPNPVKPDFTGTIGIRGLVKDTDVRITDISGNIVYQTTSLGGQAVWDGKDFNGNKVQTGVYMIFNGSPQGELKAVAKVLFIH